jgi:predicted DNA-binding transcriptional regulator YafY
MKYIFISKPTGIPVEFDAGFQGFLTLLNSYDLQPQTLGETEYPIDHLLMRLIP